MSNKLGQQIKYLASEKKITLGDLERKAGLKTGNLANILKGKSKSPRIDTINAIAMALNCSIYDLITPDDQKDLRSEISFPQIDNSLSSDIPLNSELFINCTEAIVNLIGKLNIKNIRLKQIFTLIEHVYEFSIKSDHKNKADQNFAEWIIEKNYKDKD